MNPGFRPAFLLRLAAAVPWISTGRLNVQRLTN